MSAEAVLFETQKLPAVFVTMLGVLHSRADVHLEVVALFHQINVPDEAYRNALNRFQMNLR